MTTEAPEQFGIHTLKIRNVKGVIYAEIEFGDGVNLITGANGAGKSTALDALDWVLRGKGVMDEQPIREGADFAEIEVTFTNGQKAMQTIKWNKDKTRWTASLILLTADGGKLSSPQTMIKEWLGPDVSFDPSDLVRIKPADRRDLMAGLVGIDIEGFERQYKLTYEKRQQHYGIYELVKRNYESAPPIPPGTPAVEISVEGLTAKLDAAYQQQQAAEQAEQRLRTAEDGLRATESEALRLTEQVSETEAEIGRLQERVESFRSQLAGLSDIQTKRLGDVKQCKMDAESARASIPDIEAIKQEINQADEVNQRVRQRRQLEKLKQDWQTEEATRNEYTQQLKQIEERKLKALAEAKYPIEGLGFGEDDITLDGLPFSQVNTARQIQAAIAVGVAFNPKLRMILCDHGSDLDRKTTQEIHEYACQNRFIVALTKVSDEPVEGAIHFENGLIKEQNNVEAVDSSRQ